MSFDPNTQRWPPSYDAKALAESIEQLVKSGPIASSFYAPFNGSYFQGDIVELNAPIPVIADDGNPGVTTDEFRYWLIIGNTCDIDRSASDTRWTQIVPIHLLDEKSQHNKGLVQSIQNYQLVKRFYLPTWDSNVPNGIYLADFLTPVTISKRHLLDKKCVRARMSYHAWMLLNCCLVRFLARDDGRSV